MKHRNSLRPGHGLREFTIIKILGQGGTGITYFAYDNILKRNVAIKEYLPMEIAVRDTYSSWIHPVAGEYGKDFCYGLDRFMREAETLSRFRHPNIVRANCVFSENNTAYIVMDYCSGVTLDCILKKRNTLKQAEFLEIMLPVMDGLEYIHNMGFIHRDIKPANLFIRDNGKPLILDFGSSRETLVDQAGSLTRMVSPGYAPFEQYTGMKFNQGPWTDIYGLSATMYKAVCGRAPADAMDRGNVLLLNDQDIYISMLEIDPPEYSRKILKAIDEALAFKPSNRPATIPKWRDLFDTGKIPSSTVVSGSKYNTNPNPPSSEQLSNEEREVVTICR